MNIIWATSFCATVLLFAIRGLILSLLIKWLMSWKTPTTKVSVSFLALLITIAIVSAFPPLHRCGNWIDETTGSAPTPLIAYSLDKRWFGLIDFYQFPGQGVVDNSVNAHFGPNPESPLFRVTQSTTAIDFPILVVEVLLLTGYTLLSAIFASNQRRVQAHTPTVL